MLHVYSNTIYNWNSRRNSVHYNNDPFLARITILIFYCTNASSTIESANAKSALRMDRVNE